MVVVEKDLLPIQDVGKRKRGETVAGLSFVIGTAFELLLLLEVLQKRFSGKGCRQQLVKLLRRTDTKFRRQEEVRSL